METKVLDKASVVHALESADLAGLLDDTDIDRLATAVLTKCKQKDLAVPGRRCPACGLGAIDRQRSVIALVLATDGLRRKTHLPLKCRTASCKAGPGKLHWANFVSLAKGCISLCGKMMNGLICS